MLTTHFVFPGAYLYFSKQVVLMLTSPREETNSPSFRKRVGLMNQNRKTVRRRRGTDVMYPGIDPAFSLFLGPVMQPPWIGGQKIPAWVVSTQRLHQHIQLPLGACSIPSRKDLGPALKSSGTPWKGNGMGTVFHI